MSTKTSPPGDRFNIFVEDCDLPATDDERERLLADLQSAVEGVADAYQLDPRNIRIYDGHTFSEVVRHCPDCGGSIVLNYPELMENAAYAQAHCEGCDWSGTAIYRIVDLMTYEPDRESEIFEGFPFCSGVRFSDLKPQYIPYE